MQTPECEVCGAKTSSVVYALVEGVEMQVCSRCAQNYGKLIPKSISQKKREMLVKPELVVVSDYAKRIKEGRAANNLSLIMLARHANEKDSFLERIEAGKTPPDISLAERLQKILKIKLIIEEMVEKSTTGKHSDENLTLGDVITIKKKAR